MSSLNTKLRKSINNSKIILLHFSKTYFLITIPRKNDVFEKVTYQ